MKSDLSVLFLGKPGDTRCEAAIDLCERSFSNVNAYTGDWGSSIPDGALAWSGDLIVSYLSRWIVPAELLERARVAAINFHPAPPEYPGYACTSFALYEDAADYGVTCHHMDAAVDTGPIVKVRRFPVEAEDDLASLLERTYGELFTLFAETIALLRAGCPLPQSDETWTRKPFTRKEFLPLTTVTVDTPIDEIRRRARATLPGQPVLRIGQCEFAFEKCVE